jgi:hypothetical protein
MGLRNCKRCGKKAEPQEKTYDPYNVTFKCLASQDGFSDERKRYCLKCAELYVKERNKGKGGHWVLEKPNE